MNSRLFAGALALTLAAPAFAQFNPGDIWVNTINYGGGAPRVGTGNAGAIQRFDLATNTFNLPYSNGVVNSGTSTSEGALLYDPTSNSMWLTGYASTVTTGTVNGSTSASNPRIVAQVFANGAVTTYSTATDYNANSIRAAVGMNGAIYVSGQGSGTTGGTKTYAPSGGLLNTGTANSGTNVNTRVVGFYDGNVYYSTASSGAGIFRGGATPTQLLAVPTTTTSPYGFRFSLDGLQTLYVSDDNAATGGVLKYRKNLSGTYDLLGRYVISNTAGTGTIGTRQLALRPFLNGSGIQQTAIIATTADDSSGSVPNRLISILDNDAFATPAVTVLATAPTNEVFRGVEVVPEPASLAILGVGALGLLRRRRAR